MGALAQFDMENGRVPHRSEVRWEFQKTALKIFFFCLVICMIAAAIYQFKARFYTTWDPTFTSRAVVDYKESVYQTGEIPGCAGWQRDKSQDYGQGLTGMIWNHSFNPQRKQYREEVRQNMRREDNQAFRSP